MRKKKEIKEKDLDKVFSIAVRKVGYCERCFRTKPQVQLQCSHYYTRNARSVRFDFDNCDCLCSGCHRFFEGRKNAEYRELKIKKLGLAKFKALTKRYYKLKQWTSKERSTLFLSIK